MPRVPETGQQWHGAAGGALWSLPCRGNSCSPRSAVSGSTGWLAGQVPVSPFFPGQSRCPDTFHTSDKGPPLWRALFAPLFFKPVTVRVGAQQPLTLLRVSPPSREHCHLPQNVIHVMLPSTARAWLRRSQNGLEAADGRHISECPYRAGLTHVLSSTCCPNNLDVWMKRGQHHTGEAHKRQWRPRDARMPLDRLLETKNDEKACCDSGGGHCTSVRRRVRRHCRRACRRFGVRAHLDIHRALRLGTTGTCRSRE